MLIQKLRWQYPFLWSFSPLGYKYFDNNRDNNTDTDAKYSQFNASYLLIL